MPLSWTPNVLMGVLFGMFGRHYPQASFIRWLLADVLGSKFPCGSSPNFCVVVGQV